MCEWDVKLDYTLYLYIFDIGLFVSVYVDCLSIKNCDYDQRIYDTFADRVVTLVHWFVTCVYRALYALSQKNANNFSRRV